MILYFFSVCEPCHARDSLLLLLLFVRPSFCNTIANKEGKYFGNLCGEILGYKI